MMQDDELIKQEMWKRLQKRLPERESTVFHQELSFLNRLYASLKSTPLVRAQIKEGLLNSLEDRIPTPSFWTTWKRWVPVFLPLALFPMLWGLSQESETGLYGDAVGTLQGNALVSRGDESLVVHTGDSIFEGDLLTAVGFEPVILNLEDQTQIFMAPQASLQVYRFDEHPGTHQTQAVIKQLSGQVWTEVSSLIGEDSYIVVEFPEGYLEFHEAASVNLKVEPSGTQLQVASNYVNVQVLLNSFEAYSGSVIAGDQLTVSANESGEPSVQLSSISAEALSDSWWLQTPGLGAGPRVLGMQSQVELLPLELSHAD